MIREAIWLMWARSEAGLSRLPVTEEIAGSNPVGPAKIFCDLASWIYQDVFVSAKQRYFR